MSPIAPFFGDWLFRALNEVTGRSPHPSAHLARMPEVEDAALDAALEHRMALARTVSSIVLALRNTCGINVRQPLPRIMVVTGPSAREADLEPVRAIVLDEVNVKRIEYVAGSSGVVRRSAKANFKTLGRRLGADMKAAAARIRDLAEEEISRFLEEGRISLDISGRLIGFEREDIEIVSEGIDGWQVEQQDGVTVALDIAVTDELLAEGLARETINRIQNMRKSASFDVTDRIQVHFQASERLAQAIVRHAAWIRNETLAASLEESPCPSGALVETFSIGNETLTLAVERIP
jgi:isoleucyl-tRNA synthetase